MGHQGGEGCLGHAGAGMCNIRAGKHSALPRFAEHNRMVQIPL